MAPLKSSSPARRCILESYGLSKSATGTEDEAPLHTRCTLAGKCNGTTCLYFNWLSPAVAKCAGLQRHTQRTLKGVLLQCKKKPFATAFATAETRLNVAIRKLKHSAEPVAPK
jgi:hypothetical protein